MPPSEDCTPKKVTSSVPLKCSSRSETPKILVITPEFVSKNCFFADFVIKILFLWFHPKIRKNSRIFLRWRAFFFVFTPEFMKIRAYIEMKIFFFFGSHSRIQSIILFVLSPKFVYVPSVTLSWRQAKLADRKDGFSRYFPKRLALSRTNDLLAIWSQTTAEMEPVRIFSTRPDR